MNHIKDIFSIPKDRLQKGEIGIEIEIEGDDLPHESKTWVKTQDGSLRGNSAEYVLRKPLDRKEAFDALDLLEDQYQRYGTVSNGSIRESIHIHINVQDLTLLQFYNFLTMYLVLEEVLITFCGPQREGNLFCLRASDAKYLLKALKDLTVTKAFKNFANDDFRYAAVNIVAVPKYGSLEFRSMRGTTDFQAVKTWIDLLLRVKNYSLEFDDPTAIIEAFSEGDYGLFVSQALGPLYALFSDRKDLNFLAKQGMRNAQTIAYAVDWKEYVGSIENNIFLGIAQAFEPPQRGVPEPEWDEPMGMDEVVIPAPPDDELRRPPRPGPARFEWELPGQVDINLRGLRIPRGGRRG